MSAQRSAAGAEWRYEDEENRYPAKKWCLDDFERGKLLGEGRFGRVVYAREKKTNLPVAIKVRIIHWISSDRRAVFELRALPECMLQECSAAAQT